MHARADPVLNTQILKLKNATYDRNHAKNNWVLMSMDTSGSARESDLF